MSSAKLKLYTFLAGLASAFITAIVLHNLTGSIQFTMPFALFAGGGTMLAIFFDSKRNPSHYGRNSVTLPKEHWNIISKHIEKTLPNIYQTIQSQLNPKQ